VNPIIAVFLGWVVAGESLTAQMLIGAAVIVVSVMLVTANNKKRTVTEEVSVNGSLAPCASQKPASATV